MSRRLALASAATLAATLPLTVAAQPPQDSLPSTLRTQSGVVRVERLAALAAPWGMALLPDGRLLVTEKAGRLRLFDKGTLSAPLAGVPAVMARGQGGLLDVAIDPAFATNGLVYLSYAEAAPQQPANAREMPDSRFSTFIDTTDIVVRGAAVARARLDGTSLRDLRVIWRQVPATIGRGHFGGRLAFGADGKLYITSGDRMRFDPAQDSSSNLGRVVRINPDGTIPADNPFPAGGRAARDTWTFGHRNPLGIAVEPGTGRVWIHEMGPLGGDEVNILDRGRNYGWPRVSNGDHYDGSHIPDHVTSRAYALPAHAWTPVVSPSGLLFYTAELFPAWRGSMLLGGLSSMSLIRLTFRDDRLADEERIYIGRRIRDVLQAPDGSLLLLTDGPSAHLLRLVPEGSSGTGR